jgi:hypothetical protein
VIKTSKLGTSTSLLGNIELGVITSSGGGGFSPGVFLPGMAGGAGLAPAGLSLGGFGSVFLPPVPNFVPLPDVRTGLSDSGRFINQRTGDYQFTSDGRLQGMPGVDQLVLLALLNNIDLSALQEKGPNFARTLTSIVQTALSDLVTRKLILITSISVIEPRQDSGIAVVNWLDLTTGEPQQTQF